MATALLERSATRSRELDVESALPDWEAPAGGSPARPRMGAPRYMCLEVEDPHLQGQPCEVVEPTTSESDESLVAFACGCQAYVPRRKLLR